MSGYQPAFDLDLAEGLAAEAQPRTCSRRYAATTAT